MEEEFHFLSVCPHYSVLQEELEPTLQLCLFFSTFKLISVVEKKSYLMQSKTSVDPEGWKAQATTLTTLIMTSYCIFYARTQY